MTPLCRPVKGTGIASFTCLAQARGEQQRVMTLLCCFSLKPAGGCWVPSIRLTLMLCKLHEHCSAQTAPILDPKPSGSCSAAQTQSPTLRSTACQGV